MTLLSLWFTMKNIQILSLDLAVERGGAYVITPQRMEDSWLYHTQRFMTIGRVMLELRGSKI